MKTIGGDMAGVSFAARAPDEEHAQKILEVYKDFSTAEGYFDCICEIQKPEKPPVEIFVGKGRPVFGHRKNGDIVEIFVDEAGVEIKVGEIDGERLRGIFYDVSPEVFQTLFFMFFRAFAQICLLKYDALLVHGCGIVKDGKGYLFMGPSNSGKTTIAGGCERREALSDEVVCVRREGGRWKIYSTFWRAWNAGSAELSRIFILHRDENAPELRRLRGAESAAWLSRNPYTTPDLFGHPEKMLEMAGGLTLEIPCFSLRINPMKFAWDKIVRD